MKNAFPKLITLFAVASIGFASCEEVPPFALADRYPCANPPTNPQARNLLVEEFTGVHCTNCPAGAAEIQTYVNANPGRIIPISIHTGFYSYPFSNSPQDLTFPGGETFSTFYGIVEGWPAAYINRSFYNGSTSRVLGQPKWAGIISNELATPAQIALEITNVSYDSATRALTFSVNADCQVGINTALAMEVMLTEDEIESPQQTPSGEIDTYKHKHVLRKMLPGVTSGTAIDALPFTQTYTITLDPLWVETNCNIVAIVRHDDVTNNDFKVLQAAEVEL